MSITFKHKATITIGTANYLAKSSPIMLEAVKLAYIRQLSELFGGCTLSYAQGGYVMDETGELVVEDVLQFSVLITPEKDTHDNGQFLIRFAAEAASKFGEECVLLEWTKVKLGLLIKPDGEAM